MLPIFYKYLVQATYICIQFILYSIMKKDPTPFYVIIEDNGRFKEYDVMNYLMNQWNYWLEKRKKDVPTTFEALMEWLKHEAQYMWWARCQYEIILSDWPNQSRKEKWDIYRQLMMNHRLVTEVFAENVNFEVTVTKLQAKLAKEQAKKAAKNAAKESN